MKITKCCCCLSTRTGAYIIAICGIIRGILYLSYLILLMNAHDWRHEDVQNRFEAILIDLSSDLYKLQHNYLIYCIVIGSIFSMIYHFVLLIGLFDNSSVLILGWLIFEGIIGSVITLLLALVGFVIIWITGLGGHATTILTISVLFFGLGCYFWLVVHQVYKKTKENQETGINI